MNPKEKQAPMSPEESTAPTGATTTPPAASTDWFAVACRLLAPGTTHFQASMVAVSWDAYDRLEAHGWEERRWWVDTNHNPVPDETPGARMHEHREKRLRDGTRAVCHTPTTERPVNRLCLHCNGHGWTQKQDEDGEWQHVDCEWCDSWGRVPRPYAPLPGGLTLEDFFVSERHVRLSDPPQDAGW